MRERKQGAHSRGKRVIKMFRGKLKIGGGDDTAVKPLNTSQIVVKTGP